ncbi:MAG: alpha/beta hydrolase [Opitutaceae bacterium]|nr:alpha/beta hydrolase [Opitutaceae bacterium]
MKTIPLLVSFMLATAAALAADPKPIFPLWPAGAPGSEARRAEPEKLNATGSNVSNIHHPSLTVYLPAPDKATGCAVIVVPGGGHRNLSINNEGYGVAQWLADHGIAAFVLKHRLGNDEANPAGTPQPYKWDVHGVADGQRAVRLVRSRAQEWGVRANAVGMVGFSAGGEIVAQAAMRAEPGKPDATDPIERENSRPDFQGLIYPGKSGLIAPVKGAPPAFLACGFNDRKDIAEGLANVYLLFKQAGVPTDFHVYASAGHGFGIREANKPAPPPVGGWVRQFREFLADQKFLAAAK